MSSTLFSAISVSFPLKGGDKATEVGVAECGEGRSVKLGNGVFGRVVVLRPSLSHLKHCKVKVVKFVYKVRLFKVRGRNPVLRGRV